jgi:predicted dehydrogenase
MIVHPSISVLVVGGDSDSYLGPLLSYLKSIHHIKLTALPQLPQELDGHDVIVTTETSAFTEDCETLTAFVQAGGGWLGLVHLSEEFVPLLFGAQPGPVGPSGELRVLFEDSSSSLATRLPDAFYAPGCYQPLQKTTEEAETILYVDWRYQHTPVLVKRPVGDGQAACSTLQAYDHPVFRQILYRLLPTLAGQPKTDHTLAVGLLGYPVSVGRVHGLGVESTAGLSLRAVCDLNADRLDQAGQDFPGIRIHGTADAVADDPDTDVVIVATPPNSHARLSLQMMESGKHVICEKPLALNQRETAVMAEMSERQKVHLSCYQNRRWDVDYLAIRQAIAEGLIGELFYVETFVGGFDHPCGYWHSHAGISGGTSYDWGGHYVDWIVSLLPDPVEAVICTRQNRVWHDVTNADQERIQIRFAGGQEADFMHSDIAAIRKPKWYLLGTEGAIIGHWQDVTTYEVDPVIYFHQHDIPRTEMVPDLTLCRRHPSGEIVSQKLALPKREPYLFYRNLADHLLTGEPIVAPLEDSVRVVAILEAAVRSAARGGTVEGLNG